MAEYDDYLYPSASSSTGDTPQRSNFRGKSLGEVARKAGQFVPGYRSLYGLANTEDYGPYEALLDLQNDVVPFDDEYQHLLATGELPKASDIATEAVLMFVPVKGGGRKAVKEITKNGKVIGLDVSDLQDYTKTKQQQYFDLRDKARKTEPNLPSKRKNSLLDEQEHIGHLIEGLERYKPDSDKLPELRKKYLRIQNQLNDATIDMIDDPRDFGLAAYKNNTGLYKTGEFDIYPTKETIEATNKNLLEFDKYLEEKYPAIYQYDLTEKVRNDIKREYPNNYEEIIDYIVGQGRPAAYDLNFRLYNLKQK